MAEEGTEQALQPGTVLDAYEIQGILGIGGFGITYQARDANLERQVAIKEYFPNTLAMRGEDGSSLLARSRGDEDSYDWGLKRFLDEARTLARFHNQYIVHVHRFLEANQTAYLVMDYENGLPLSDVLKKRTLDEQSLRKVLAATLLGLRAVHAEQFLHRDIKPANIFLRRKGPPLLLDFGAARQALQARASSEMTVIVTPGFAPLEQYGEGDAQGAWSDLYALGATAYFAMFGKPPRDAAWRMQAARSGIDDPVSMALDTAAENYSAELRDLVGWMLEPLAMDRPQHCDDVLAALKIRGLNVKARTERTKVQSGMTSLSLGPTQMLSPTEAPSVSGATEAPSGAPTMMPGQTVAPTTTGGDTVDEGVGNSITAVSDDEKTMAAELLADHLGPIASVLVRNTARAAESRQAFIDALAEEIDDPDVRAQFTRAFTKH